MTETFFRYLQHEKRVSPHTLNSYRNDLLQFENFAAEFDPEQPLPQAHSSLIRSWVIHLVESGLEPTSINRKIACLRTYFKFLIRNGHLDKDPMIRIRALKTSKKLPGFVKSGDMERMLDFPLEDGLEAIRDRLILELFYATGIRLSELVSLREPDIDMINGSLRVLGKRNKERVIPFPLSIVELIRNYQKAKLGVFGKLNHDHLLVTQKGEPCYSNMIYRIVKKYLRQFTSVEKKSPHILRHTYATHLLNNGAEINAVKDLLGHSSLAATQVYTHNSTEKLKKAFQQAHPKA